MCVWKVWVCEGERQTVRDSKRTCVNERVFGCVFVFVCVCVCVCVCMCVRERKRKRERIRT